MNGAIWRFFKWNSNLKITRQIDLVLHNLVYECSNLTNFSCLWISKIWFGIVKSIKSWINGKKAVEANSPSLCRTSVATVCGKGKQRKVIGAHWRILKKEEWEWVRDRSEKRPPPYLSIETFFSLSQCILQANKRARRRPSAPRTFYRHTDSSGH